MTPTSSEARSVSGSAGRSGAITYPRVAPRSRSPRADSWWGKAWVRAVEESAYGEGELRKARADARAGRVGGITVESGSCFAAVEAGDELWSPRIRLPVLDDDQRAAFVEVVASQAGRVAALLAGTLPFDLVEEAEEAGVELLPYGGEFDTSCGCEAWTQPCVHALTVLVQCTWLLDDDPFVLIHLRGISREQLLHDLHGQGPAATEPGDLEVAYDAAVRAQRLLKEFDSPPMVEGRGEAT